MERKESELEMRVNKPFVTNTKRFIASILTGIGFDIRHLRSTTSIPKRLDGYLISIDSNYRSALISMYRGEPQLGIDGKFHPINSGTRISPSQGLWLYNFCLSSKPKSILEIGMAYGYSTLYFLAAIKENQFGFHTAIDPFQHSDWYGIGLNHVNKYGYSVDSTIRFRFIEERSDRAAIDLARSNSSFDLIFVDGNHRFDDVLVDFYLYAPLCKIGGYIILDDTWMSSIQTTVSFIQKNRADFVELAVTEPNIAVFKKIGNDTRDWVHFRRFIVSPSMGK